MTLRGHKNHYNVKLLCGYGASISLRNNKVCLKGGKDIFYRAIRKRKAPV